MQRTATCACQSISITVAGEPDMNGICHCDNCKRRTGSAFGMSAYFRKTAVVEQRGTTAVYAFHHSAQNHDQARHFCPTCGTTLFWFLSVLPDQIGIASGCFAGNALPEPALTVATGQAVPWLALPEGWRRAELKGAA
jgi:hypothetical protein